MSNARWLEIENEIPMTRHIHNIDCKCLSKYSIVMMLTVAARYRLREQFQSSKWCWSHHEMGGGEDATNGKWIFVICAKIKLFANTTASIAFDFECGRKKSNYWFYCSMKWHSLLVIDCRWSLSCRGENWAQINMIYAVTNDMAVSCNFLESFRLWRFVIAM